MRIGVISFLCAALLPATVHGQGFGIYEEGACTMSRGGAGVAEPCEDGSAIYVNPAGLAGQRGLVIGGGGTLIFGTASFTSDLGPVSKLKRHSEFPPYLYVHYGLTDKVAAGIGLYVPYGLGVEWPIDFGGRFVSYDSNLRTVYVQPTLAATFGAVSIGGGPTFVRFTSVELNRREDLARVPLPGTPGLTAGAL